MGDEDGNHCQAKKLILFRRVCCKGSGGELGRGLEPLSKELRSFAMSGLCHPNKPYFWAIALASFLFYL